MSSTPERGRQTRFVTKDKRRNYVQSGPEEAMKAGNMTQPLKRTDEDPRIR